jgi:hypothetical protein
LILSEIILNNSKLHWNHFNFPYHSRNSDLCREHKERGKGAAEHMKGFTVCLDRRQRIASIDPYGKLFCCVFYDVNTANSFATCFPMMHDRQKRLHGVLRADGAHGKLLCHMFPHDAWPTKATSRCAQSWWRSQLCRAPSKNTRRIFRLYRVPRVMHGRETPRLPSLCWVSTGLAHNEGCGYAVCQLGRHTAKVRSFTCVNWADTWQRHFPGRSAEPGNYRLPPRGHFSMFSSILEFQQKKITGIYLIHKYMTTNDLNM